MKKIKSNYSIKEKILISFSFWPTLFIGIALGLSISLLLINTSYSFNYLSMLIANSIIVLVILGVVTRIISIFFWKKYNCSVKSDLK
jgi:hypothetical protein